MLDEARLAAIRRRLTDCPPLHPYVTGRGGVVLLNGPFPTEKAEAARIFLEYIRADVSDMLTAIEALPQERQ